MNKKNLIIGSVVLSLLLISVTAYAFSGPNYEKQAKEALAVSDQYLQQAMEYSCRHLGEVYSDCFAHKEGACQLKAQLNTEFESTFSTDVETACGQSEPEAEVQEKEVTTADRVPPTDPLFFGDEEQEN